MPDAPATNPPSSPVNADELEIHTIPDSYYGVALKANVQEKKPEHPESGQPVRRSRLPVILVIVFLFAVIGGGFVYFNRDLLFPKPPTTPIVQAPPVTTAPVVPSAPTDAVATSTNPQSVLISWTDTSSNESGFRIERNDGSGTFTSLTSLPPNSTSFLDVSVQPKTGYAYRVRALNAAGESDPSNEAVATTPDVPPPPPEAPKLPPAGLDTDSDGITDLEETLYGADVHNPDTDNDGFLDGNEVFHLYNPAGSAPAKLLDLALIKTVEAPIGWVLGVPSGWAVTMDKTDGSKTTVDSKHGETFVVTVEDNTSQKPVLEWYLATHPDVTAAQVLQYRSKGGYTGIIGADLLSTYIPWGNKIFVFTYNLNGQTFINYRTTYSMMLNSLMLSGLPQVQAASTEPLPFEPSATTSGLVAQPVPVEAAPSSPESTTTQP
ncbi:MAG: fibronectin type III domain-containing protein [Patescibacteria group bacterium]